MIMIYIIFVIIAIIFGIGFYQDFTWDRKNEERLNNAKVYI